MAKHGWFNLYREGMPFPERLAKDAKALIARTKAVIRHKAAPPTIVTWPDFPSKRASISAIASAMDAILTNKPRKCDVLLFFDDRTQKSELPASIRENAIETLNAECRDIRKTTVETHHKAVFGYGSFIDPFTHTGTAVCKSDGNALHDGRYVECPLTETITDAVYQRVINNRTDDGLALDYRVAVMGNELAVCYEKYKPWELRFTNDTVRAVRIDTDHAFSHDEQRKIIALVQQMKIDFCEVDVLRDRNDGRIHLIDVNPTPYGPPAGLSSTQRQEAIELLSSAFQRQFIRRQTSK